MEKYSGKLLNLEHLRCNYKYLKRVFVKYSKDTYVFDPQERLEPVPSAFLIQVLQVSETCTSESPTSPFGKVQPCVIPLKLALFCLLFP